MTSEEYFAKRNGGKTPIELQEDGEFVGARWCQRLMTDFAKHKIAELEQRLKAGQHEPIVKCQLPDVFE